ncbi:hypothetical protein IFR41_06090 [Pseudomonas fluorescens]|uniref:hypothetical protein n=1 Tax=Pseudomonas sp. G5001 TaxID=2738824 RepID=UPI0010C0FA71|nr:hypothetical protein [Pseudomonas sp. G5001]MBD8739072.1 hypothetical protein [Pseudomonas fluorescens]NWB73172.1 hypothetical protein [Pseudomonas sp. G5001]TKK05164.1 hypothetical protein PflCFBP13514_12355 [Pseudomonas fluorescens]
MNKIDNELIDPIIEPDGEKAHRVARIMIGAVPVLGGAGVEIFNSIIDTPMNERRIQWMNQVGNALNDLIEKSVLTEQGLQHNETFITTVSQASMLAIRSHQQEKLEALRNAVLNVAIGHGPEEDLRQLFLNFIDVCTVTHIRLLSLMNGPEEWSQKHGVEFPSSWSMGGIAQAIEHAFPDLRGKERIYKVIWGDLYQRGLINTDGLGTTMSRQGILARRTTELGAKLIDFLSEPVELE